MKKLKNIKVKTEKFEKLKKYYFYEKWKKMKNRVMDRNFKQLRNLTW